MKGVEQVLSAARCFVGLGETPSHENTSQIVDWFLRFCKLKPGLPWCAAYLSYVGWHALSDDQGKKSMWPLPVTAACQTLYENAKRKRVVAAHTKGERGDAFVVWYSHLQGGRFGHAGFILSKLGPSTYLTIEGNTSAGGSREGWCVTVKPRKLKPQDKVIKWATLL